MNNKNYIVLLSAFIACSSRGMDEQKQNDEVKSKIAKVVTIYAARKIDRYDVHPEGNQIATVERFDERKDVVRVYKERPLDAEWQKQEIDVRNHVEYVRYIENGAKLLVITPKDIVSKWIFNCDTHVFDSNSMKAVSMCPWDAVKQVDRRFALERYDMNDFKLDLRMSAHKDNKAITITPSAITIQYEEKNNA